MKTENLRLNADYLLLGNRGAARVAMLFPRFLRALATLLFVLGMLNADLLYSVHALGVLFVLAAALLRVLIWCTAHLRDRWFMCQIKGEPAGLPELLAGFSFSDLLGSFRLSVVVSVYCFVRTALFLVLPLCALAVSFLYAKTGVSPAVMAVLVCGNTIFLLTAGFFCAAALYTVIYAGKLSCFDKTNVVRQFYSRLKVLDKYSFSLLNFGLFFGGLFGVRKEMAGLIYSGSLILSTKIKADKMLINY